MCERCECVRASENGGGTRTAREETVLTEDCYGVYEEQADVKYASEEKHEDRLAGQLEFCVVTRRTAPCRVPFHAFGFPRPHLYLVRDHPSMQRLAGACTRFSFLLYRRSTTNKSTSFCTGPFCLPAASCFNIAPAAVWIT